MNDTSGPDVQTHYCGSEAIHLPDLKIRDGHPFWLLRIEGRSGRKAPRSPEGEIGALGGTRGGSERIHPLLSMFFGLRRLIAPIMMYYAFSKLL
jgi:hypothetical protein